MTHITLFTEVTPQKKKKKNVKKKKKGAKKKKKRPVFLASGQACKGIL